MFIVVVIKDIQSTIPHEELFQYIFSLIVVLLVGVELIILQ